MSSTPFSSFWQISPVLVCKICISSNFFTSHGFIISFFLTTAWNFNSVLESLDQMMLIYLKFAVLMPSWRTYPSVSVQLLIFLIPLLCLWPVAAIYHHEFSTFSSPKFHTFSAGDQHLSVSATSLPRSMVLPPTLLTLLLSLCLPLPLSQTLCHLITCQICLWTNNSQLPLFFKKVGKKLES